MSFAETMILVSMLSFGDVKPIFVQRCSPCHATMGDKNWEIESNVRLHKEKMIEYLSYQVMPPGNATGMTDKERTTVIDWLKELK